jgi:hypothetical protein
MKASLALVLGLLAAPAFAQIDLPGNPSGPGGDGPPPGEPALHGKQVEPEQPKGDSAGEPSGMRGNIVGNDAPAVVTPRKHRPFTAGGEVFGQLFPISSHTVQTSTYLSKTDTQMGVYAGGRFLAGYAPLKFLRFTGLASIGYMAAGIEPGKGDDGIGAGLGVEVDFEMAQGAIPFVRLNYEWVLLPMSRNSNGTLANDSFTVAIGGRFGHAVSTYLMAGSDYAGGTAIAIGLGLGFY